MYFIYRVSKNEEIFLLQLPSNVTLMVWEEYLFCLFLYCTDYMNCNMLRYMKATAI